MITLWARINLHLRDAGTTAHKFELVSLSRNAMDDRYGDGVEKSRGGVLRGNRLSIIQQENVWP